MRPHQAQWLPGSFWPGEGLLTGESNPPLLRINLLMLSHKYTGLDGKYERGKILSVKYCKAEIQKISIKVDQLVIPAA